MRQYLNFVIVVVVAAGITGCGKGDALLRTRCHVIKGDKDWVTPEGQHLQIEFVPIPKDGKPPKMYYWAEVNQETGEFRPDGPQKTGMPPGKYRIALALMDEEKKDVFGGKFNTVNSPYIFEFEDNSTVVVVDLDDPPAQLQASASGAVAGS